MGYKVAKLQNFHLALHLQWENWTLLSQLDFKLAQVDQIKTAWIKDVILAKTFGAQMTRAQTTHSELTCSLFVKWPLKGFWQSRAHSAICHRPRQPNIRKLSAFWLGHSDKGLLGSLRRVVVEGFLGKAVPIRQSVTHCGFLAISRTSPNFETNFINWPLVR